MMKKNRENVFENCLCICRYSRSNLLTVSCYLYLCQQQNNGRKIVKFFSTLLFFLKTKKRFEDISSPRKSLKNLWFCEIWMDFSFWYSNRHLHTISSHEQTSPKVTLQKFIYFSSLYCFCLQFDRVYSIFSYTFQ
jgi:hypothetical protein